MEKVVAGSVVQGWPLWRFRVLSTRLAACVIEDAEADVLYIEFSDRRPAATRQIDEGTIVDLDADGRLIGIEVICRHRAWPVGEILDTYDVPAAEEAELRQLARR